MEIKGEKRDDDEYVIRANSRRGNEERAEKMEKCI